jgi:AcrR family transcriptional regulator
LKEAVMEEDLASRRRREILVASAKVFAQKGYHAAAIADIAAELGWGHGTFYRYFKNKLDIFGHVVSEVLTKVHEVNAGEDPSATNSLPEYRAQVMRIAANLFDLFQRETHLAQLLFIEAPGVDREIDSQLKMATEMLGNYTAQYLINGVSKGFLRADLDVQTAALAINAMIFEGVRQVSQAEDPRVANERWTGTVVALMFGGLAFAPAELQTPALAQQPE